MSRTHKRVSAEQSAYGYDYTMVEHKRKPRRRRQRPYRVSASQSAYGYGYTVVPRHDLPEEPDDC